MTDDKHYGAAPATYPDGQILIEFMTDDLGQAFDLFRQFNDEKSAFYATSNVPWYMFEIEGPFRDIIARFDGSNWVISDQAFLNGAAMVTRPRTLLHNDRFVRVDSLAEYRQMAENAIHSLRKIDWNTFSGNWEEIASKLGDTI